MRTGAIGSNRTGEKPLLVLTPLHGVGGGRELKIRCPQAYAGNRKSRRRWSTGRPNPAPARSGLTRDVRSRPRRPEQRRGGVERDEEDEDAHRIERQRADD